MERLFNLPPWVQAPPIDYGIAVGIPSRLAERGIHRWKLSGPQNCQRSSHFYRSFLFYLKDNPMPVAGSARTGAPRSSKNIAGGGADAVAFSSLGGSDSSVQPLNSTFNFATTVARETALSAISSASSQCADSQGNQGAPSNNDSVSIS